MNFVICITIFIHLLEHNSAEYKDSNEALKHEKRSSRQSPFNEIINHTAKVSNLKSNIFDKMLSNELLSIKNHLYEKDTSYSPSVHIVLQGNVATPTLEVKQKWPIDPKTLNSKSGIINVTEFPFIDKGIEDENSTRCNATNSKGRSYKGRIHEEPCNIPIKEKIVGLRSLPENTGLKICSCMKTNPRPTCTHFCTNNNNICTHVPNDANRQQGRPISTDVTYVTYSIFPLYVTYPAYFWEFPTATINPYDDENPTNKIKISKTKGRKNKNKKLHITMDTYDDNGRFEEPKHYYDDLNEIANSMEVDDEKLYESTPHPIITNYDSSKQKEIPVKDEIEKLHFVDRDEFVNDVVGDLKNYYADVLIKDCYCSLSSRNYVLNIILLQCLICAYLLVYY